MSQLPVTSFHIPVVETEGFFRDEYARCKRVYVGALPPNFRQIGSFSPGILRMAMFFTDVKVDVSVLAREIVYLYK